MVVVGAVELRVKDELAREVICHGAVGRAGEAAEQLNARLHQGHLCPGADAAAEDDIHPVLDQEAHQCPVALPVGGNDLAAQELAVFGLVNFELFGPAKVLEHLPVFVWNCNFHRKTSFLRPRLPERDRLLCP